MNEKLTACHHEGISRNTHLENLAACPAQHPSQNGRESRREADSQTHFQSFHFTFRREWQIRNPKPPFPKTVNIKTQKKKLWIFPLKDFLRKPPHQSSWCDPRWLQTPKGLVTLWQTQGSGSCTPSYRHQSLSYPEHGLRMAAGGLETPSTLPERLPHHTAYGSGSERKSSLCLLSRGKISFRCVHVCDVFVQLYVCVCSNK